jgi:hypothetical protein
LWAQLPTSGLLLEFLLDGYAVLLQHAQGNQWCRPLFAGSLVGIDLLMAGFPFE